MVDDEPDVLELVKDILTHNRYRVWTFSNAKDMIAALKEIRPDLILLDIMMPGMNGHELCKYIKSSDKLRDIKICFVSAKNTDEDIAEGRKMGADDYICKPFENRAFVARVKTLIGSAWEENAVKPRESKPTQSVMSTKSFKKHVAG